MKSAQPDLEALAIKERHREISHAQVLEQVCKETGLGTRGPITPEEFINALEGNKLRACMSVLGLRCGDPQSLYTMIVWLSDAKGTVLEQKDFISGCMRLQGTASNMDMCLLKSRMTQLHC